MVTDYRVDITHDHQRNQYINNAFKYTDVTKTYNASDGTDIIVTIVQ
jgi:hypothetical protein